MLSIGLEMELEIVDLKYRLSTTNCVKCKVKLQKAIDALEVKLNEKRNEERKEESNQ